MKTKLNIQTIEPLLFLAAAAILAYNFYVAEKFKYDAYGDAADYVSLGVSLAKVQKYGHLDFTSTGELINSFKNNSLEDKEYDFRNYSTWRPPVWPFLIAGIFKVFGYKLIYLLIFKFLLHLIGIFIFYRTLKLLELKQLIILPGVFLYAVSPAWQLYSRVFLSEPVSFFIITLWAYFVINYLQTHRGFLWQGIIGGILVLAHPYNIFLPFTVWLFLFLYKQLQFKQVLLLSAACSVIIGTWILRNSFVLDTNQIVITTSSGAVMAKGWNKNVLEKHTNTKGDLADEGLVFENYPHVIPKKLNEVERSGVYQDASIYFIKDNPHLIFPIIVKKVGSAFNPFPETSKPGFLETGRWIFHLLSLISMIYLLFYTNNRIIKSLVLGVIFSTLAITIITYSGFRFRVPQAAIELLFVMFATNSLSIKQRANKKLI